MGNYKKAVERAEGKRWHREEIHCSNGIAMIGQERRPAFGRLWPSGCPSHPAQYRPPRDVETKHL